MSPGCGPGHLAVAGPLSYILYSQAAHFQTHTHNDASKAPFAIRVKRLLTVHTVRVFFTLPAAHDQTTDTSEEKLKSNNLFSKPQNHYARICLQIICIFFLEFATVCIRTWPMCGVVYGNLSRSGRGLVRLRRLTGGQEIASSNLVAPTIFQKLPFTYLGERLSYFKAIITSDRVRFRRTHFRISRRAAAFEPRQILTEIDDGKRKPAALFADFFPFELPFNLVHATCLPRVHQHLHSVPLKLASRNRTDFHSSLPV